MERNGEFTCVRKEHLGTGVGGGCHFEDCWTGVGKSQNPIGGVGRVHSLGKCFSIYDLLKRFCWPNSRQHRYFSSL